MVKASTILVTLLLCVGTATPAAAQHLSYHYKPAVHTDARRGESEERDSDDYADGYRQTERRRYTYTPVRRDRHRYSPYRYRATVRYSRPEGHQAGTWWAVGNRLPSGYLAPVNVVDFRRYRLPPPPNDFKWVRVENDVYLAAAGTGLIRDVLYEFFY